LDVFYLSAPGFSAGGGSSDRDISLEYFRYIPKLERYPNLVQKKKGRQNEN